MNSLDVQRLCNNTVAESGSCVLSQINYREMDLNQNRGHILLTFDVRLSGVALMRANQLRLTSITGETFNNAVYKVGDMLTTVGVVSGI